MVVFKSVRGQSAIRNAPAVGGALAIVNAAP
jgi:hypothetical protein